MTNKEIKLVFNGLKEIKIFRLFVPLGGTLTTDGYLCIFLINI
jgi:hypothetical protein